MPDAGNAMLKILPTKVTIHCSASKNGVEWDIAEIRKMHVQQNGWKDVGYNLILQPDGEVQKGRGLNEVGSHVAGHNRANIGICLIGTDRFTMRQFNSLRSQLDAIRMVYSIPFHEIYCHYEFDTAKKQGKTCPNIRSADLVLWYVLDSVEPIKKYLFEG